VTGLNDPAGLQPDDKSAIMHSHEESGGQFISATSFVRIWPMGNQRN
jgi:hypothetical protein